MLAPDHSFGESETRTRDMDLGPSLVLQNLSVAQAWIWTECILDHITAFKWRLFGENVRRNIFSKYRNEMKVLKRTVRLQNWNLIHLCTTRPCSFWANSRGQKRHQVFVAGNIKCERRLLYATKALLRENVFFSKYSFVSRLNLNL